MNDQKQPVLLERAPSKWWDCLGNPSAATEVFVWAFLILTVFAIRAYLVHLVPVALWSDDGGPIYSLLIAACAKVTGDIDSVMLVQHVLGGISVLLAMVAMRALYGRSMLVPLALCSYAYAVYGLPVHLEHLIRNETLLFFFSSLALASWLFAIQFEKPHWLWVTGLAAGMLMVTKSVFGPFPLVVILGHLFYWRSTPKLALKFALIFSLAFIIPFLGVRTFKTLTVHNRPPEPQAGILLYARTAQFTWLEGGIEPEIKQQIRQEVEEYRAHVKEIGHLDNNLIIYKTIVPALKGILERDNKLPADLNHLCLRLAIEAISHHKAQYAKQVLLDLTQIHLKGGYRLESPSPKEISSMADKLRDHKNPDPLMQIQRTVAQLQSRTDPDYFNIFHGLRKTGWLFLLVPVLFTSLFLPLIIIRARDRIRLFWIGAAVVWVFTLVLLSTVGRPLDRYLIPAVPVMFFTLTTAMVYSWEWLITKTVNLPAMDANDTKSELSKTTST
jgi:4-amino-4-deoxy-L-arabinose transferase-like glycosyltransferase